MEWILLIVFVILVIILLNILIGYIAKKNGYLEIYKSISHYEIRHIDFIVMIFFVVVLTIFVSLIGLLNNKVFSIIYFSFIAIVGGTISNLIKLFVARKKKKNHEFVDISKTGYEKDKIIRKERHRQYGIAALLILLFSSFKKK